MQQAFVRLLMSCKSQWQRVDHPALTDAEKRAFARLREGGYVNIGCEVEALDADGRKLESLAVAITGVGDGTPEIARMSGVRDRVRKVHYREIFGIQLTADGEELQSDFARPVESPVYEYVTGGRTLDGPREMPPTRVTLLKRAIGGEALRLAEADVSFAKASFNDVILGYLRRIERNTRPEVIDGESQLSVVNGPGPALTFHWNGKAVSLTGNAFKIVEYVWRSPDRCADEGEMIEHVWGDIPEGNDAVKSAVRRANAAIAEAGCPMSLTRQAGKVFIR